MGWSHQDISKALRYRNVKSFRSSVVHKEQMQLLDELVGKSFDEGKILSSGDLKDVMGKIVKSVGEKSV